MLTGLDPEVDVLVPVRMSNAFRRWTVQVVNKMDRDFSSKFFMQRIKFWQWLFRQIHVGERRFRGYQNAQYFAGLVRGSIKAPMQVAGQYEKLYIAGDVGALEVLKSDSGLCYRQLRASALKLQEKCTLQQFGNFLDAAIGNFKPAQLMELLHVFRESDKPANRVFRVKNGTLHWQENKLHELR